MTVWMELQWSTAQISQLPSTARNHLTPGHSHSSARFGQALFTSYRVVESRLFEENIFELVFESDHVFKVNAKSIYSVNIHSYCACYSEEFLFK